MGGYLASQFTVSASIATGGSSQQQFQTATMPVASDPPRNLNWMAGIPAPISGGPPQSIGSVWSADMLREQCGAPVMVRYYPVDAREFQNLSNCFVL